MRPKKYIKLSEAEEASLEELVRESPNHRIRQRSQALLWSHRGKDRMTIAESFDVKLDTISSWLSRWGEKKLSGLEDLPRSGRPSILTEEEKKR